MQTHSTTRKKHPLLKNLSAKIMALPMISICLFVFVGMTFWTLMYSFTKSRLLPSMDRWVGLYQYEKLWSNDKWLISLDNLGILIVVSLPLSIAIAFILAALLDQKIRLEDTFRTIFLYPFALSFVVTGLVWQWILNPEMGLQSILHKMGFSDVVFNPLYNPDTVLYAIAAAGIWQSTGFTMCLMLAGMRAIDDDVWKAARVDGIGKIRTYLFVIIPMMKPTFFTVLVLGLASAVKTYDVVVVMSNGGPGIASSTPAMYAMERINGGQNIAQGFAAAMMLLLGVILCMIPLFVVNYLKRKEKK